MKLYQAPFLNGIHSTTPLQEISAQLGRINAGTIDVMPWPAPGTAPLVRFIMAYGADSIFLRYHVTEKYIRAVCTQPNEPVYKDSCVEMFIAFPDEQQYYNFEFNLLGTPLVEFGADNRNRTGVPAHLVKKIRSLTSVQSADTNGLINWELTLAIPFELFCHHNISSLQGKLCAMNFHKCGDALPEKHYQVWNPVRHEYPNFHLIEYFGQVRFLEQS